MLGLIVLIAIVITCFLFPPLVIAPTTGIMLILIVHLLKKGG
jgi:hypothetical protein